MSNLAVDLMPKSFEEIYGHEEYVQILKSWIEKDNLPFIMFVSGNSGAGKGTLVQNFIRTTLCLNRVVGESTNCGHCAMCKIDPRTTSKNNNVMWVVPGGSHAGTIDAQFKEAISYAHEPPIGNPINQHQYHKFIVFDEIQSIKAPLLEQLAHSSETVGIVGRNRVTYILITMDEHKIRQKQPTLVQALKSRAGKGYINLGRPSDLRLHQYCKDKLCVDNLEIRNALVQYAEGSYRQLIAGYEMLCDLPELSLPLVQARLNLATDSTRLKFWELFNKATNPTNTTELKEYWEYLLEKFPEDSLVTQLLNDIDLFMCSGTGTNIPIEFIKALCLYLTDPKLVKSWFIINQFTGTFTILDLSCFTSNTHHSIFDNALNVT